MANRHNTTQLNNSLVFFRLKPLSVCVRLAIAGGVFIGSVSPVQAELPVPSEVWATMGQVLPPQVIGNTLHVDQKSENAVLNWDKFDVGAENRVEFHQPGSNSIALNRIFDQNPSQILGQVTANGQIYLYNQNGFVFGEKSVINVNTLVASTLNISDEVLNNGILKQIELGKHALGEEANKPETATKPGSFIRIEKGAQIKASRDAGKNGSDGLVIVAAPTVENNGSISTDEFGQIILVASKDKVYLQPTDKNSPFKGMLVEVDTGGKVSNAGDILARQGNVTLQGFSVNQGGRITATTSVNENGSIRLLAKEKHAIISGKLLAENTIRDTDLDDGLGTESAVTFAPGSVTQIVADKALDAQGNPLPGDKQSTAIDAQSQKQSYLEVVANKVHLQGSEGIIGKEGYQPGAAIVAASGKVDINATNGLTIISPEAAKHPGRIVIDKDASIDVSGTKGVKVAMERNVAAVSVQTFDLRDSPQQKNGVLQGQTVRIDVRKGTEMVDTTGATNSIQRGIDERLGKGGEINLTSSGDVIVNGGAVIDISGGSVDYQDGYTDTTQLLTDYGRIVDIGEADPNEHYVSIFGVIKEVDEKWGITKTYNILDQFGQGRFEKGYTEGQSAGALNIQSPLSSWNGQLIAGSDSGRNQRDPATMPFGGSFTLNAKDGEDGKDYVSFQDVRFQTEKNSLDININDKFPTHEGVPDELILPSSLINHSGVQNVVIKTAGNVEITEDASIAFEKSGGQLSLDAGSIDVKGHIYSAGGAINLTTNTAGGGTNANGQIKLHGTSELDVSGRWVNDFEQGPASTPIEPIVVDGGTVNLTAKGDLTMAPGSSIRADGGAWLTLSNELTAGKGGEIKLAAVVNNVRPVPSLLTLDGKLSVQSLSQGGTLDLTSERITVAPVGAAVDTSGITPLVLRVKNGGFDFAKNSGFGKINLTSSTADLTVKAGTTLKLLAQNSILQNTYRDTPSEKSMAGFTDIATLPEHLRQPVDLSLTGFQGVNLETGSKIIGDKESSINLQSKREIYVDGLIDAPSGSIGLTVNADADVVVHDAAQAIWLGSHAQLLAQGTTRMNPRDALDRRTGSVLKGGDVTLTAQRGYVVNEAGSLIDVSGTQATLDLPTVDASSPILRFEAKAIGSDGGHIAMTAAEGIVLDGSLYGKAGSETNRSGRLDVNLDRSQRQVGEDIQNAFTQNPMVINVRQDSLRVMDKSLQHGDALDDFLGTDNPGGIYGSNSLNGKAVVSSQLIEQGGFGDVRLISLGKGREEQVGEVHFQGNVDLSAKERIEINTRKIVWEAGSGAQTGEVIVDTPYLKMGADEYFIKDLIGDAPLLGNGTFTTKNTQLIELTGKSRWDGFSQINLNSAHDLRSVGVYVPEFKNNKEIPGAFVGSMTTAANLNLSASQIYPSTLTNFTFAVKNTADTNSHITISGKNTDVTPLSANGVLNFEAAIINQNGVLKAPFGTINLNAAKSITLGKDSLTSVSADKQIIPFGVTSGGVFWLYPLNANVSEVYNSSPDFVPIQTKQVNFSAPEITLKKDSLVDISGGGDLQAYEFLKGAGGSNDYLDPKSPSYQGGFAIVPSLGSTIAPYDPSFQSAGFSYKPGSSVYLSGTDKLPAGTYTILPARYALLDGAFLVTPQANSQDQVFTTFTKDRLPIVAGYQTMVGSGTQDARWSGFRIEQGADVRKQSQYDENKANEFFVKQALAKNFSTTPLIPKDSGQIVLDVLKKQDVENTLTLEGNINSTPDTDINGLGRGGKLDISADSIKVVKSLSSQSQGDNSLEVLDSNLSGLNLDSLFLGGIRSSVRNSVTHETETTLTVKATDVEFSSGVEVKAKDLIAAAKEKVVVKSGATLTSNGKVNTGDSVFNIMGDGALLRVSGDKQVVLNRTQSTGQTGDLLIEAGATINGKPLTALESVLLDASKSTQMDGDILMNGGSLSLNANAINIGEVENVNDNALNFTNQQLSNLAVDELQLNSRKFINFYGNVGQVDKAGKFVQGEEGLAAPLQFGRLVINAAGFSGFNNNGKVARLQADNLQVSNLFAAKDTKIGNGQGRLDLITNNYTQGSGDFGINGFNTVNINVAHKDNVAQGFTADGKSVVTVAGDLNLMTDYVTSMGGANLKIDAQGHQVKIGGTGYTAKPLATGLGGAINVFADAIDFDAGAYLPSGQLALTALKGDLKLGKNANIDLAGHKIQFADIYNYTPGGTFSAVADKGKVTLAKASSVNLSPGGDTNAAGEFIAKAQGGNLIIKAPEKTIELLGTIKAAAGSAKVDVASFAPSANFDQLMHTLKTAGISESIYFRTRQADIVQASGNGVNAHAITLVADKGRIDVSGSLTADGVKDGKEGGAIELYAGDKINLNNGSALTATGGADAKHVITGKGGKVLLSSVDSDNDGVSGISIKAGSLIDVSGKTPEQAGNVRLRALRTDKNNDGIDDNINIDKIEGTVKGKIFAEGVKKYGNADIGDDGEINAVDIATIKSDTDGYMAAANTANLGGNIVLLPGVEIDYQGNLVLQDKWDFVDWRYNGVPGNLLISTSGDFHVDNSITDGFRVDYSTGLGMDLLQTGDSWSYQLTAGSDLNSADKFATVSDTQSGSRKLIIGSTEQDFKLDFTFDTRDVSVRTGTGDIKLASSGDVQFLNKFATVYNAGKAEETNRYGKLPNDYVLFYLNAEYPVAGGDLAIKAGKNITGASSDQFITEWLPRMGDWGSNGEISVEGDTRTPTAWGVSVTAFRQNIGSFGGGKVDISASGDINNLSVMMPTTGKQEGEVFADGSLNSSGLPKFQTNVVTVNGGGEMKVKAGGDIAGGAYFLGKGEGSIDAGGEIKGQGKNVNGPNIIMGDTNFALNANQGISLSAVSDPMVISGANQFYTYTDTSGISVKSLSGDVKLGADTSVILNTLGYNEAVGGAGFGEHPAETRIYPASLQSTAFGGSIIMDTINLFPSPSSTLSLLAKQDITGKDASSGVFMRDVDMRLLPTSATPKSPSLDADSFVQIFDSRSLTPVPILHSDDKEPARLITQEGDIKQIQVNLSKQAIIQAGRDLSNLKLDIQNINPDDVTHLNAGRDLSNNIVLTSTGALDTSSPTSIEISGPGNLLVKTGRNVNLGVSAGLNTVGNKYNSNLPRTSANITVLAGLNKHQLDYSSFIAKYLPEYPVFIQYSNDSQEVEHFKEVTALITDFMRHRLADTGLTESVALKLFKSLNAEDYSSIQPQLNALIIPVYEQNSGLSYQGMSNEKIIASLKGGSSAGYDSLIGKYIQHFSIAEKFTGVNKVITDFMRQRLDNVNLSGSDAATLFKALKADDYLSIQQQLNSAILPVYYNEIVESGSASAVDPASGNDRGFAAINTLFPQSELDTQNPSFPWKGDVNLIFSTIQTQQGGNINLLVPGGQVNAGLAFAFSGLTKPENELGIIALEEGNINAVIRDDFQVNQSRVFTQNGGDIMLWSTEGNIDAGRGAKTALSIPETDVTYAKNGKITKIIPPVSGSGIRAVVPITDKNATPGDIALFAPGGVINAGEAGIAGNNITFSATAVLGAGNVQIGGISTGVPVASVGSLAAGLSGVSNLSASVSQTAQAAADMSKDSEAANKKKVRGRLTVKVLRSGA